MFHSAEISRLVNFLLFFTLFGKITCSSIAFMADDQALTKAQIKQMITDEVRKAVKTQLSDSTNMPSSAMQFGGRISLTIGDFKLDGVMRGKDAANDALLSKLQKLAKPKNPTKKNSAAPKEK